MRFRKEHAHSGNGFACSIDAVETRGWFRYAERRANGSASARARARPYRGWTLSHPSRFGDVVCHPTAPSTPEQPPDGSPGPELRTQLPSLIGLGGVLIWARRRQSRSRTRLRCLSVKLPEFVLRRIIITEVERTRRICRVKHEVVLRK